MKNEKNTSTGLLSIVSTPIGNNDDISQRAIVTIKKCDILVCEEGKIGSRLLFVHKITKPIELLNEHNEHEVVPLLIKELQNGKRIALISDCGTPVFADPGLSLVQACIARDISMEVVPGASSIMSAIVLSGFDLDRFLFAGFLSRKHEERDAQLINLSKEPSTVVLFETPYRLKTLLEAAAAVMPDRKAFLGCNLTFHYETRHYGTFRELFEKFKDLNFKGEFVIVFEGCTYDEMTAPRQHFEENRSRYSRNESYRDKPRRNDGYRRDDGGNRRSGYRSDDRKSARRSYDNEKPRFRKSDDGFGGERKSSRRPKQYDSDKKRSGGFNKLRSSDKGEKSGKRRTK